jgi:hypothetical protein
VRVSLAGALLLGSVSLRKNKEVVHTNSFRLQTSLNTQCRINVYLDLSQPPHALAQFDPDSI